MERHNFFVAVFVVMTLGTAAQAETDFSETYSTFGK